MSISVLILTKNEERDLPACLASVGWSDDVHVLDSLSSDRTVEIARAAGAQVTQRPFDDWASHQNWALSHLPFRHAWVLYVDADERVSPELRAAAAAAVAARPGLAACRIRRRDFFADGTWLRHAQISPYYLRLFRPERMRYERLVNPVSIVDGPVGEIGGFLDHYPFSKGIGAWLERHIRYADLEARMIAENRARGRRFSLRAACFERDFTRRRAQQKELFYRLPGRPLLKLGYLLVIRRAFLDGRAGMTYAFLQSIYEYFIVLKQAERERSLPTDRRAGES
jgi:glycosyltransferase involved in cell wall biosynthesis